MYRGTYKLDYPKTVWKIGRKGLYEPYCLIELEIPAGATIVEPSKEAYKKEDTFMRMEPDFKKCRCDKAIVKKIYDMSHNIVITYEDGNFLPSLQINLKKSSCLKVFSTYNSRFAYRKGAMVKSFLNENNNKVCTEGIHFFNTRREAIAYALNTKPFVIGTINM